jgi:hypothetical protein
VNSRHFPVIYWAPLASVWIALSALAAISGDPYLAAAALAGLGLLILSVRLDVVQRRRYSSLAATVSHIDAKVEATRRYSRDRH